MTFEVLSWIVAVAWVSSVIVAAGHLSSVMGDNLARLDAPAPHQAQARSIREATITWLSVPAAAYLLAVVTNLGSSLIEIGDGFSAEDTSLGITILLGGFVLLEVIAVVAVQRARNARTGLTELADWSGLVSEIRVGGARRSVRQSEAWLEDVEEVLHRLSTEPDRRARRSRAAAVAGTGQGIEWRRRPIAGLFPRRRQVNGRRVSFRAREMGLSRVLLTSAWVWAWAVCVAVCLGFWSANFWYLDATPHWPGVARFFLVLLASAAVVLIAARGRLLWLVRTGLRDAEYEREVRDRLDQLAEEQRRLRQPPPQQPPPRRRLARPRRLLGR